MSVFDRKKTGAVVKEKTLACFLRTALLPIGNTMYVYGGGWNEEDTGAGTEAVTLGLSPEWAAFSALQDEAYDYTRYRYRIHNGLDCSGYVGWVVYNTLETVNGKTGYVLSAAKIPETYARWGFGTWIPQGAVTRFLPGDIAGMNGHVWISLGTCPDRSVLLVHASPPGVSLCGTCIPSAETGMEQKGQAVYLAERYMRHFFPCWYKKYPNCSRGNDYLTTSSVMRWNENVLADPEGLRCRKPEEVLEYLFTKK